MVHTRSPTPLETLTSHLVNSPLSVIEWDDQFRVKFWSGQAETIFGWSEDELRGQHPADWQFVHEDDAAAVDETMAALLNGDVPRNISINRNYTRDGRVIYCEWYNSVVRDDQGNLLSVLSLIQDVTDRIVMEAKLRQLQKMESIGQLTGGVAHDFNNLLTVIMGNGEFLAEQLESQPALRELAEMVVTSARRGADLTHQLLAFARRQPLRPKAVDVSSLLRNMRTLLDRTLGGQIETELLIEDELWPAEIDPTQLESAVLNLCINARDAIDGAGQLTIEVGNRHIDRDYVDVDEQVAPGAYVMVAVSDSGVGMSAEVMERIFEPFYTTKASGRGTGLGLSMVFGFVKQSRGYIKVYSEVDEGTTIRIYLPRSGQAPDADVDTLPDEVAGRGGTESILLVEDDERVREYAAGQLQLLGYRVTAVANGVEAMQIINEEGSIDLLFTDVVMPGGINGRELARQAQAVRPELRVLYTSGYTENAIIHQGRLDAGVLLLSKPYERSALARMVREALSRGCRQENG